jgi:hypothetical protein
MHRQTPDSCSYFLVIRVLGYIQNQIYRSTLHRLRNVHKKSQVGTTFSLTHNEPGATARAGRGSSTRASDFEWPFDARRVAPHSESDPKRLIHKSRRRRLRSRRAQPLPHKPLRWTPAACLGRVHPSFSRGHLRRDHHRALRRWKESPVPRHAAYALATSGRPSTPLVAPWTSRTAAAFPPECHFRVSW